MRTLLALTLLTCASNCEAHKLSDSYLSLQEPQNSATLHGQCDIALRDLDYAVGVDANRDGDITWGEVKASRARIFQYALQRLRVEAIARGDRQECSTHPQRMLVDTHVDGAYAVLKFSLECPYTPAQLAVHYSLLFEVDPTHRGLLKIVADGASQAAVLPREAPTIVFSLAAPQRWQQFAQFVNEGVWHIWKGYDHILFLLTLLIPAVMLFRQGKWQARESSRAAAVDVIKVVSAFTVAHSLTLALAVLGWVQLPSRLVESAIAATVLLGALNNLWPVVCERRWIVAFVFGLVHGLGFASVLADLGLHGVNLALALIGFNCGVEVGQLGVVLVFLPLALWLRDTLFYRRVLLPFGSGAIGVIATVWLFSRMFGIGGWQ